MNRSNSTAEGGNVPYLINKLCNYYSGNNSEVSSRLFKLTTNFLSLPLSNKHLSLDEQYVVNQIHKVLASKQSAEKIQNFDLLYAKLQKTSILRNKASVLTLFLNLYKEVNSPKEFSMLQELQEVHLKVSDTKSQTNFLPDDANEGIKKIYAASSRKLAAYNSTHSSQAAILPESQTPLSGMSVSDFQFQIALKEKASSTSCSTSASIQSITESDLMQEVIYALQGIEGRILKKEPGGLGFIIDTKTSKSLGAIQKSLVERLAGVGFLHNQLKQHCEDADKQTGVIGQSLIATLREELAEYYKTLAILQAQLKKHDSELTLRRMIVWIAEPNNRLQWLAYIAEQCTDKKGGALISAVHGFLQHGSVSVQKISSNVLLAVCRPLYLMMSHWLLDGELSDPFSEFFIEARNITSAERLWHDKYHVKTSMVPSFISMDQAKKILATGKNINFLRQICKDSNQLPGKEALQKLFTSTTADSLYVPDKSIDLHLNLENVYRETSHRVLHMLKDKYRLLEHLQALRRYLLLGQGDFIRHLLELLAPELAKPAQNLYAHTLSAILESAIRVTNAQFEDEEILQRLTVEFLHHSHGDTGWDIFTLVYIVDGPVGTIFEPAMPEYRSLFGSLWKAKRMEYVLSNMRKQQLTSTKLFRNMKALRPILHQIHILSSTMIHFLHQTQYYFLFEVLECSWAEMMKQVNQAECLDDVINAHTTFLNSVQCGVLLDSGSESNSGGFTEMCGQLRIIYNLILQLESTQENLYKAALDERTAIIAFEKRCEESQRNGKFAVTLQQEKDNKERTIKFQNSLNLTKHQIKQISHKYKQFVQKYLNLLSMSSDQNLQLLSVPFNVRNTEKVVHKSEKLSLNNDKENCTLEFSKSTSTSPQVNFLETHYPSTPLSPVTPTTCSYGSVNSLLRHRGNSQKRKHV